MRNLKKILLIILAVVCAMALFFAVLNYLKSIELQKENYGLQDKVKMLEGISDQENANSNGSLEGKNTNIEIPESFSSEQLKTAQEAIVQGITINDPKNDFYKYPPDSFEPDGKPNNPDSYQLGYTDLKSLSAGADNDYIYFKSGFWGQFPEGRPLYNNDILSSTVAKMEEFIFTDKDGKKDSADLIGSISYGNYSGSDASKESISALRLSVMMSPNGNDENRKTLFGSIIRKGMIFGGQGYDYIIVAYPLELFGINYGDTVRFRYTTETGSLFFHHECIDTLLGSPDSKFGMVVEYELGSNTYKTFDSGY